MKLLFASSDPIFEQKRANFQISFQSDVAQISTWRAPPNVTRAS